MLGVRMQGQSIRPRIAVLLASLLVVGGCTAVASPSGAASDGLTDPPAAPSQPLPSASPTASAVSGAPATATRAEPAWHPAGNMTTPHAFHTATLLPDGRVLVTGGLVNDRLDGQVSAAAEWYEPSDRQWSATSPMAEGRWGHTATLLRDGTVLVAGSYAHGHLLASAELYDPDSGRWTATGTMRTGRGGHAATLLPDGRVLLVGGGAEDALGEGGPRSATAEIYDPATGQWGMTAGMSESRMGFTATLLGSGLVLVAGGGGGFTSAELYDPASGRWTVTGSMTEGRMGHTATLLPNGEVLVSGGCACSDPGAVASAELYDPTTGTWRTTGTMHLARIFHTATLLDDGTVLVVDAGLADGEHPPSAELYDPSSGRWTATASPNEIRLGYGATLLLDGRVLVTGSYAYGGGASTELFDPGTPG